MKHIILLLHLFISNLNIAYIFTIFSLYKIGITEIIFSVVYGRLGKARLVLPPDLVPVVAAAASASMGTASAVVMREVVPPVIEVVSSPAHEDALAGVGCSCCGGLHDNDVRPLGRGYSTTACSSQWSCS